jgi:hypothetical protein
MPKSAATPVLPSQKKKKALNELFEERDRTKPGSREETKAAEKILEAVFPDTNAD